MAGFPVSAEGKREIRDKRLYRDVLGFETFEEYCKVKWGMGRNYVNKTISSSDVIKNLGTIVPITPKTESQARPLTRLEPQQQIEAWKKVVETAPDGKITAALVTKVVKQIEKKDDIAEEISLEEKEKYPYSDADDFVTMAISQLERIRHDDPLKKKALARLKKWVETFERKKK